MNDDDSANDLKGTKMYKRALRDLHNLELDKGYAKAWRHADPCLDLVSAIAESPQSVDKSSLVEEGIPEKLLEIIEHCCKQDDQAFIDEPELLTLLDGTMKAVESMKNDPMLCRQLVKANAFERLGEAISRMAELKENKEF